jgi:hypothetical protein
LEKLGDLQFEGVYLVPSRDVKTKFFRYRYSGTIFSKISYLISVFYQKNIGMRYIGISDICLQKLYN